MNNIGVSLFSRIDKENGIQGLFTGAEGCRVETGILIAN